MKSDIRRCSGWRSVHDAPVYTLSTMCPDCGGPAHNSAPPPFTPVDRYGKYRRALKGGNPE